jgi:hypothetical protein
MFADRHHDGVAEAQHGPAAMPVVPLEAAA